MPFTNLRNSTTHAIITFASEEDYLIEDPEATVAAMSELCVFSKLRRVFRFIAQHASGQYYLTTISSLPIATNER